MLVENPPQINYRQLYKMALDVQGKIKHLYLHWSAGRYGQIFDDYHINIDYNGQMYLTCSSLAQVKSHTYHRNSESIGISLCCGYGALLCSDNSIDYGSQPPTQIQIETLAKVIALLVIALGLEINFSTVTTHAEAACMDGYGPGSGDSQTRWDLLYLPDLPITQNLRPGGAVLRGKAQWYRNLYLKKMAHAA